MIVNVNPYDTGFDENSHVMKFSALAREVTTTTVRPLFGAGGEIPMRRKVTISIGGFAGKIRRETHLEVLEGVLV